VQGSGEDWATIHRQAGGGAQVSSLWHAESPWAQFIPPNSTARSGASCGTSCVLSDCVHNLSGWARWRPRASQPRRKATLPASLAPWPRSGPSKL